MIVGAVLWLIIIAAAGYSLLWLQGHWHTRIMPIVFGHPVVDPDSPDFDRSKFRFEYYSSSAETRQLLIPALLKMFPPGTDKDVIDKVLVTRGESVSGSLDQQFGMPGAIRYDWPDPEGWFGLNGLSGHVVIVTYNIQNKSAGLRLNGARLYGVEASSTKRALTSEAREALEAILRPLRKKYIGNEDGF